MTDRCMGGHQEKIRDMGVTEGHRRNKNEAEKEARSCWERDREGAPWLCTGHRRTNAPV